MRLSIRNFPFHVTDDDLRALLEQFGAVDDAFVIVHRETRLSRGFGFADLPNLDEAEAAVEGLNGYRWHGRVIIVSEAKERAARQA